MPRIARSNMETNFLHVIVQGIAKEYIFKDGEDIKKYLYLIKEYSDFYKIKIIAYCVMNNHAHFLIYTKEISLLSKVMQKVNIVYGRYYNKKNQRVGYVFRDRFLSEPIKTEIQLLNCMVYIHKNPIKANIVNEISKYRYSSYNDYIEGKEIAKKDIIKLVFGTTEGYLEQFKKIHIDNRDENFIEIYMNIEEKSNELINNYCTKKKISIENIRNDKEKLKAFLSEVRDKGEVSNRKLSKVLQIGREKLRKM